MSNTSKHILTIGDNEIYNKLLNDSKLTFTELCTIIKKPRVKEITSVFLKGIFGKRHQPFKAELFLSLFLIYRFPDVVFEGEGTDMDKRLLTIVNELVKIMQSDLLKNRNVILHNLLDFKEKFNIWKRMDLQQQLKLYSETYYELELLKLKMAENKEANLIYRESIIPLQNKIKKVVTYLGGEKGVVYLNNYKTQHMKLTVLLEKKLRDNLRKAFWDKFETELLEEPPKYSQIPDLFKDIHKLYMSIMSCIKNEAKRKQYEDEFNSILDIEYMDLLLNKNGLTEESILTTCVNILDQIKKIGIPKNDLKITKIITEINTNIENVNMCEILKYIIELLEELQMFFMNQLIDKTK